MQMFDAMMLNSELERIGYRKIDECQWYDSLSCKTAFSWKTL